MAYGLPNPHQGWIHSLNTIYKASNKVNEAFQTVYWESSKLESNTKDSLKVFISYQNDLQRTILQMTWLEIIFCHDFSIEKVSLMSKP